MSIDGPLTRLKQLMEEVLQHGPVMNTFHPIGTVTEKTSIQDGFWG